MDIKRVVVVVVLGVAGLLAIGSCATEEQAATAATRVSTASSEAPTTVPGVGQ